MRESDRHVLLLYSEPRLTPAIVRLDTAIRSSIEAGSPVPVDFYTEFLDLNMFDGTAPQPELRELLRRKYAQRRIDLIVAGGRAVSVALRNRDELFSRAPIVFIAVDRSVTAADLRLDETLTGTWLHQGWAETLDLARRLHPGTQRAVVIVGSTPSERTWANAAREQLSPNAGSTSISYLVGLPLEQVLKEVAALPEHSIVLALPMLRDGTGRDFAPLTVMSRITAASRAPVYGLTDSSIGSGAVGGVVVSFDAHGKIAADLALKVMAGERPPPSGAGTTIPMFDDRQIKRWGIDRRLLPAGSVILFHEPTVWERYHAYIIVGIALLLLQSGFIAALLVQRVQRRRVQRNLSERLKFETLLSDLSGALASCPDSSIGRELERGLRRIVEDLGSDRASLWELDDPAGEARLTHTWTREGIPPVPWLAKEKEYPWIFREIRRGRVIRLPFPEGLTAETLTDRQSMAQDPTRSTAIAPLIEGGVVVGGLSVGTVLEERQWPDELVQRLQLLADIFANALARQRAARAADESAKDIRDLAGRLITAQEEERRHIARELHDGVNQDLAAFSIALSAMEEGLPEGTPIARRQELARLQARAVEVAEAIRHLSHELHPGVLQYAGLPTALRSHCREFEREYGLPVTCHAAEDLGAIPPDLALCLYRVTQEALKNAARHAKASHVWVNVTRDGDDIVLTIRDDGRGFSLAEARARGGLGLISLDERVRLAGGQLAIDTKPLEGTEVIVVVPQPREETQTTRGD